MRFCMQPQLFMRNFIDILELRLELSIWFWYSIWLSWPAESWRKRIRHSAIIAKMPKCIDIIGQREQWDHCLSHLISFYFIQLLILLYTPYQTDLIVTSTRMHICQTSWTKWMWDFLHSIGRHFIRFAFSIFYV